MEVDHFLSLFDKLDKDRQQGKSYCDVTISVNNELFPAHRCILGTFCVYFDTLFQDGTNFKQSNIIELGGPYCDEVTPAAFKTILNFCYTKQSDVTEKSVYDVLAGSEFLQVDRMKRICVEYLKTLISPDNFVRIYKIGVKGHYTSLLDRCMDYFLQAETEFDFDKLTFEEFRTFIKRGSDLLQNDKVFKMITAWIATHQNQQYFDELVEFVDLDDVEAEHILDNTTTKDLVLNSNSVLRRRFTLKLVAEPDDEKLLSLGSEHAKYSVQKYHRRAWHKCTSSQKPIYYSAVASSDTHVFVIDGSHEEGFIQMYDINKDIWSYVEHILKTPRYGATATIIGSRLYLSAGSGAGCYLSSTEVFEISADSCVRCHDHYVPDLKVARCYHASVTLNEIVYFIGGTAAGKRILSSCESINVVTRQSVQLPSLYQGRSGLSAVVFDGSIIATGGFADETRLSSVERFSFVTNQWTTMQAMAVPRHEHSALVFRSKLFVIGGDGGSNEEFDTSEVYDASTDKWKVHSLTTPGCYPIVITL